MGNEFILTGSFLSSVLVGNKRSSFVNGSVDLSNIPSVDFYIDKIDFGMSVVNTSSLLNSISNINMGVYALIGANFNPIKNLQGYSSLGLQRVCEGMLINGSVAKGSANFIFSADLSLNELAVGTGYDVNFYYNIVCKTA
jgi:hypothetical protein